MTDLVQRIREKISKNALIAKKRVAQEVRHLGRSDGKRVIFVAGVQRSGTNMMMDVLERNLRADVFHESDQRAFHEYEMLPRPHIHGLLDKSRTDIMVIKSLCELHEIRSLMDEFEPAQAVWMVRNFRDMINSHLRRFEGCPDRIRRMAFEGDTVDWRGRGMSPDTLEILRKHYHPDISPASAVGLFWYMRNILFFEQGLDADPRVRTVTYEKLAAAPGEVLPGVFDFLDLEYDPKFARYIFATSVGKNEPPSIEPEIASLCENLTQRFNELAVD